MLLDEKEGYVINGEFIPAYNGPLNASDLIKGSPERRAVTAFRHQLERTRNTHDKRYSSYGGQGVRVAYDIRPFVSWFIHQYGKRATWIKPSVGRIDHSGDYCFENIELIELSDNSKERIERLGNPNPPKAVYQISLDSGDVMCEFPSVSDAYRALGDTRKTIQQLCDGTYNHKRRKPYTFQWVEGASS